MKRLLLLAAVTALAVAKPELYREKEDFQYSRSSSDEGTKSGFYGAQRGNMGGNYEKAHNMDTTAQNHMSGLVRQVEGELGDTTKMRTGSVFTAANSRGVYGSGNYDLNNLEGRNFQEGVFYDDTAIRRGQSSSSNNAHYSSNSHNSLYNRYKAEGQSRQISDNLQSIDNAGGASQFEYGKQAGSHSSGYHSQSGFHGEIYDHSNTDLHSSSGSNMQSRLVSGTPVRVVLRPGSRVTIPVAAQTYDAADSNSAFNQRASNTEVLTDLQQTHVVPFNNAKHYESSYKYQKEWEKHDTQPIGLPLPTVHPTSVPQNSELYDETQSGSNSKSQYQARALDSQRILSNNMYRGYNTNVQSASINTQNNPSSVPQNSELYDETQLGSNSNSQYQSSALDSQRIQSSNMYRGYNANVRSTSPNTQHHILSSDSNAYSHGVYNSGSNVDSSSQVDVESLKPKSYQSSYSYHKSWERQGDPYIIKPASSGFEDGQLSQKLTAASNQAAHSSHQYGSHSRQSHQSYSHNGAINSDCDENGHVRVARSYDQNKEFEQYQQGHDIYDGPKELGQQTQSEWEKLEDLGQQTQTQWDNFGQEQASQWDNLGQNAQNTWENLGQQTQENFENKAQQSQDKWNYQNLEQQTQNMGQEGQDKWNNLDSYRPYTHPEITENVQQHTQDKWNNFEYHKMHNQGIWDTLDDKIQKETHKNSGDHNTQSIINTFNQQNKGPDRKNNVQLIPNQTTSNSQQTMNQSTIDNSQREKHEENFVHVLNNWSQFLKNDDEKRRSQDSISNEQTKPIWEKIHDNQPYYHSMDSALESNTDLNHRTISSNGHNSFYSEGFSHENEHNYFNQETHRFYGNHKNVYGFNTFEKPTSLQDNNFNSNIRGPSQGTLNSLWDKINNIEQFSLGPTDNDVTSINTEHISYGTTGTQKFKENEKSYHDTHNDTYTQNTYQNNLNGSHITILHTGESGESKNETMPINSTEEEYSRPLDVGRGDIGVEEYPKPATTATTKYHITNENSPRPQVLISNSDKNPLKTPEEIEALSLTKEVNENITTGDQRKNSTVNKEQNSELSVLSLADQKQQTIQEQNNSNKDTGMPSSTTSSSAQKHAQDITVTNEHIENHESNVNHKDKINHSNENINIRTEQSDWTNEKNSDDKINKFQQNKYVEPAPAELDQQLKQDNYNIHHQEPFIAYDQDTKQSDQTTQRNQGTEFDYQHTAYLDQQSQNIWDIPLDNFGQQSENVEQQSQNVWDIPLDTLGQQSENSDQTQNTWNEPLTNFGQQSENFNQQSQSDWNEPLTNFDQQSDNFNQQSQSVWNEPLTNKEQQTQTAWEPNEKLQKSELKEVARSEGIYINNDEQKNNHDNVLPPQLNQEITTDSPTTEKPGFWKSVGNQFTSAKDKIASWFKRS